MKSVHLSSAAQALTLKTGLRKVFLPVKSPDLGEFSAPEWQIHATILTVSLFGLKFTLSTYARETFKPWFMFGSQIWMATLGHTSFTLIKE
jgi:hypothetical protein